MIHPKAHVEGSDVHESAQVWQFASVIRGARVGAESVIGANCEINGAVVGERCRIGHGVVMGPGIVLGNDVFVGPGVVFCNDAYPRTHKDGFDADQLMAEPTIRVEDGASIGANAMILPGSTIRSGAMVPVGDVVDGERRSLNRNWRPQRMKAAS